MHDSDGVLTHFVSVQQDMTDLVQAEQKNRLLARALDASTDPIQLTDRHAHIVFVNAAFTELTGYRSEELIGKTPAVLRSGEHDESFYKELRATLESGQDFRANFINRKCDGSLYYSEQTISPIFDEKKRITNFISINRDITERVKAEQVLQKAATLDGLTGLFNRYRREMLLSEAHQSTQKDHRPLSLVMCDIDYFKRVNDRHGHPVGDRILKNIALILRQAVRAADPVIRWGGEEFLILLSDCNQSKATELAERIRQRVESHCDVDVGQVTLSLGLASLQQDESIEQLIKRSDDALYASKSAGRNRVTVAQAEATQLP